MLPIKWKENILQYISYLFETKLSEICNEDAGQRCIGWQAATMTGSISFSGIRVGSR